MKLNHINDKTLLNETKLLVDQEREILSRVLWHLKEIDQRKLYSAEGCASLFDYCVKRLKYSEGQASRRVSACRLLKELPELSSKIESGELNLTQLNQARNFFMEENITNKSYKEEIISKLEGRSTREIEKILWSLRSVDTPKMVTVLIKEETFEKLKLLQALKAHTCPDMDSFFLKVCSELQTAWNPAHKKVRSSSRINLGLTRYVPQKERSAIWNRDQGKCQNCGSIYALEIDHIKPYAKRGKSKLENLRLLCRNCNQRKGLEVFGQRRSDQATCLK